MYHAQDRRTHRYVHAGEASAASGYLCPTCKAHVFLRAGGMRQNHFAHMPRQGKRECEEFHPSNDLLRAYGSSISPIDEPIVEPVRLSLELQPDPYDRRGARKWRLCVILPRSANGHGRITFDFGSGDLRAIHLSAITLQSEAFQVDPTVEEFGAVWVSPEVATAYGSIVQQRLAGLDRARINAFRITGNKYKARVRSLHWGESYYVLWHRAGLPTFPPGVIDQEFANEREWSCARLTLPYTADIALEAWLQKAWGGPVSRPRREWALVYPAAYAFDEDGSEIVPDLSFALLALRSTDEQTSEVVCTLSNYTERCNLTTSFNHLIAITAREQSPKTMHLSWDGDAIVTLVARPASSDLREISVQCEFMVDGVAVSASLHGARCRALLSDVRRGVADLVCVRIPPPLVGEMRSRKTGELNWTVAKLAPSPRATFQDSFALGTDVLRTVVAAICDKTSDLVLTFGAFGEFQASGKALRDSGTNVSLLPRPLRQRIEWLCLATMTCRTRHGAIKAINDASLLEHFQNLRVPRRLASHKRAIDHEVTAGSWQSH